MKKEINFGEVGKAIVFGTLFFAMMFQKSSVPVEEYDLLASLLYLGIFIWFPVAFVKAMGKIVEKVED